MKFDVDLNSPRELEKARIELTRMLSIVEYALTQFQSSRNGHHQKHSAELPMGNSIISNGLKLAESAKPILDAIEGVPKVFTTSDIIVALGDKGKESRNAVKFVLMRAVNAKRLTLLEAGKGRRPSKYEKIL